MTVPSITPSQVRTALLLRDEIALLDIRHEAVFATGHPLFAANMAAERIALEAEARLPRKDVRIVVYDAGEGLVPVAAERLAALGYTNVCQLDGGLQAWKPAGYELFQDVNSYAKAFGELVEFAAAHAFACRGRSRGADRKRRQHQNPRCPAFRRIRDHEHPRLVSVPGAELVLRAGRAAPDPETTIIVNCAGRTRSIIGTQSLINAGVANKVMALRNGTIGWTLARQNLEHGADRRGEIGAFEGAEANARDVAYRAGVRHIGMEEMQALQAQADRTLYRFDVRSEEEYTAGHLAGFRHYAGGQLVQEIDMAAPVRGARIVLTDNRRVRADMTASWLAQMGWETYVLEGGYDGALEARTAACHPKARSVTPLPPSLRRHRYQGKRDAGLSRLGIRSRRAAPPRRHPWILRHMIPNGLSRRSSKSEGDQSSAPTMLASFSAA